MNTYLYSGDDIYRLEKNLKTLLEKNEIGDDQVITIDASSKKTFQMESVLNECNTLSLFGEEKKCVIVRNPYFLNAGAKEKTETGKKKIQEDDARLTLLEQYLKNPNPETLLVFYCHGFTADSRKKEFKLFTKYQVEQVKCVRMDAEAFDNYVDSNLKKNGFILDRDARAELGERIGTDTMLFQRAFEKMDLYGKKELNLEDIKHLVSSNSEVDVFKLTTAFTKGNLTGAIASMQEMLTFNYDYPVMIQMIAKRLRMIYNVRKLHEKGYSDEEIAVRMHTKKGYIYYVLKDSSSLSSKQVLKFIKDLADLEQSIKAGRIDPKDGFERFLLENGKRKNAGYRRII